MKKLFVIFMMFAGANAFAQWTYKTVDSPFDGSFKKAYAYSRGGGAVMLEDGGHVRSSDGYNYPYLILTSGYFCNSESLIEFVFVVNGENKKYDGIGYVNGDKDALIIDSYIWNPDFEADFKNASKLFVRVNNDVCDDDYYEVNMSGSTAAYNFIVK